MSETQKETTEMFQGRRKGLRLKICFSNFSCRSFLRDNLRVAPSQEANVLLRRLLVFSSRVVFLRGEILVICKLNGVTAENAERRMKMSRGKKIDKVLFTSLRQS
jgi:hypothetical protein